MKKTIVCFGDSNTYGYDTASNARFDENTRWPMVLDELLGDGYAVKEEGLPGRTAAFDDPLTEGLNGCRAIVPVLNTHSPVDWLIVMLGTNDVKQRFGATPENIQAGMQRLLRKALALPETFRDGVPKILLVCPPPILPIYTERVFYGEFGDGCDTKSERLPELYQTLAVQLGIRYLDASQIPGVSMSEEDCGIHMQAECHRRLAEAIAEMIRNS